MSLLARDRYRQKNTARGIKSRGFSLARAIFISLVIFDLSMLVSTYRISAAPDIFTDEIIYTRAAVRVAGEGALVWDTGDPFLVHPPLYFLAAGAFHYLTGDSATPLYAAGNIFTTVFHMRILNSIFAALTAVVLYWLGRQIMGDWLGIFYAALFILDPFALRINRRAMLETLAVLLGTAALLVYLHDMQRLSHRLVRLLVSPWTLVAGLLFGAALLTKELAFLYLLIPALFGLWELWRQRISPAIGFGEKIPAREAVTDTGWIIPVRSGVVIALASLVYAIYPLWVASSGFSDRYLSEKSLGLLRLFGLVQITGWNRPGISFFELLMERLNQYGTSYILLGAGAVALVAILLWGRENLAGRLLAATGLVLYPVFGFIAIFGSGNDQFFYFLLVPAILLVGYAIIVLPSQLPLRRDFSLRPAPVTQSSKNEASAEGSPVIANAENTGRKATAAESTAGSSPPASAGQGSIPYNRKTSSPTYAALAAGLLLALIFSFNSWRWWTNYTQQSDNAYTQFADFVRNNLPPGEPINASGDPIKFRYFLPDHPISFAATPEEAVMTDVHYYALAPKDVIMRYGRIQPTLAAWIQKYGTPIFAATGTSYGDIYLYQVSSITTDQSMMIITGKHAAQGTRFDIAKAGSIWTLVLILLVFGLATFLLVLWLGAIESTRSQWELRVYLSSLLGESRAGYQHPEVSHPNRPKPEDNLTENTKPPDSPPALEPDQQRDIGD